MWIFIYYIMAPLQLSLESYKILFSKLLNSYPFISGAKPSMLSASNILFKKNIMYSYIYVMTTRPDNNKMFEKI